MVRLPRLGHLHLRGAAPRRGHDGVRPLGVDRGHGDVDRHRRPHGCRPAVDGGLARGGPPAAALRDVVVPERRELAPPRGPAHQHPVADVDAAEPGAHRNPVHARLQDAGAGLARLDDHAAQPRRRADVGLPLVSRRLTLVPAPELSPDHVRAALAGTAPLAVLPDGPPAAVAAARAVLAPDEPLEPGADLVVVTSGSTGSGRGVLLSADALTASATATHERLGGPGSWLLALPVSAIAGLQVLCRSILAGKPTTVLARDESTRRRGRPHARRPPLHLAGADPAAPLPRRRPRRAPAVRRHPRGRRRHRPRAARTAPAEPASRW